MAAPRFSAWQVVGLVAAALTLVTAACLAGLAVGHAWGRATERAARPAAISFPTPPPFEVPPLFPPEGLPEPTGQTFLGITYSAVDPAQAEELGLREGEGAVVLEVVPDGPADRGGVAPDDIILEVDGRSIRPPTLLRRLILSRQPGDRIDLLVLRQGEELTLSVVLGARE